MLALVLTMALGAIGASAEESQSLPGPCVKDTRLKALTKAEMSGREDVQAFSKEAMWKMPKLAQKASEKKLDDCESCNDAEVQVELMMAQIGENPLLNELNGIYYPIPDQVDTKTGVKMAFKTISHEVPEKIKKVLVHRSGALNMEIKGYREYSPLDGERLAGNKDELEHLAPSGLGPFFSKAKAGKPKAWEGKDAKPKAGDREAKKALAEYATHVRVLREIEKSSTKGSGVYMVLKDGLVMAPNFVSQYKKVLDTVPKDWDVLFLRTGPTKNNPVRCEDRIAGMGPNIYEMRHPVMTPDGHEKFYSNIDAYIVRKQSIGKILKMLHEEKAAPLPELMMSVHEEKKERTKSGKVNYKASGIYSYEVTDSMLAVMKLPKAPVVQVKVKDNKPAPPKPQLAAPSHAAPRHAEKSGFMQMSSAEAAEAMKKKNIDFM